MSMATLKAAESLQWSEWHASDGRNNYNKRKQKEDKNIPAEVHIELVIHDKFDAARTMLSQLYLCDGMIEF